RIQDSLTWSNRISSSMRENSGGGYGYTTAAHSHTRDYLLSAVMRLLGECPAPARLFELGCGNGAMANELAGMGYDVIGVDPSVEGIRIAKENYTNCRFSTGSAYDDLAGAYGTFDVVLSLEVVEHVFFPRRYAETVERLLSPGGMAIISTPYHGYLKNLAISLMNKWEHHADPLWDYGHIKFWTRPKLVQLFREAGLSETSFTRVGRVPQLAKSMVLSFRKDR
ncbi:MAG: class I SAM-dependent methyltransferase, partial [Blastocatellia bacterium]